MNNYLNKHINAELRNQNEAREASHKSSGKLSASRLGWPLQWQILHAIGVPQDKVDEYTLRKFLRGRHVEDWLRGTMPDVVDIEKFVEYRNVVGYIDVLIDMTKWGVPEVSGVIPHEIKSTANSNFKWIKKSGYKRGHALQGAAYALAMGSEHFVLDYVASDDYRVLSFLCKVSDFKEDVDSIVERYNLQLATGIMPKFEPEEKWQANVKYNNYFAWAELSAEEIETKLKTEYLQSYKKLKRGALNNG